MTLRWRFPIGDGGKIRGCSSGDDELFKKMPYALFGREDDSSCSLKMESDIDMNELIFRSS